VAGLGRAAAWPPAESWEHTTAAFDIVPPSACPGSVITTRGMAIDSADGTA
jgi:hypothetical protein